MSDSPAAFGGPELQMASAVKKTDVEMVFWAMLKHVACIWVIPITVHLLGVVDGVSVWKTGWHQPWWHWQCYLQDPSAFVAFACVWCYLFKSAVVRPRQASLRFWRWWALGLALGFLLDRSVKFFLQSGQRLDQMCSSLCAEGRFACTGPGYLRFNQPNLKSTVFTGVDCGAWHGVVSGDFRRVCSRNGWPSSGVSAQFDALRAAVLRKKRADGSLEAWSRPRLHTGRPRGACIRGRPDRPFCFGISFGTDLNTSSCLGSRDEAACIAQLQQHTAAECGSCNTQLDLLAEKAGICYHVGAHYADNVLAGNDSLPGEFDMDTPLFRSLGKLVLIFQISRGSETPYPMYCQALVLVMLFSVAVSVDRKAAQCRAAEVCFSRDFPDLKALVAAAEAAAEPAGASGAAGSGSLRERAAGCVRQWHSFHGGAQDPIGFALASVLKPPGRSSKDLRESAISAGLAFLYSAGRMALPFACRMFPVLDGREVNAVPFAGSLGWLQATLLISLYNGACCFVFMYTICEAIFAFRRCLQMFFAFNLLWKFPPEGLVQGNPFLRVVDESESIIPHLDVPQHQALLASRYGDQECCFLADFHARPDERLKGLKTPCIKLWWVWRDLLFVHLCDKRVMLELVTLCGFVWLLSSVLFVCVDIVNDRGIELSGLLIISVYDLFWVGLAVIVMLSNFLLLQEISKTQLEALDRVKLPSDVEECEEVKRLAEEEKGSAQFAVLGVPLNDKVFKGVAGSLGSMLIAGALSITSKAKLPGADVI